MISKRIELDEASNSIKYFEDKLLVSHFTIGQVLAIGEVTTDKGPFAHDHFLLFITTIKTWHSIPTEARGFNELLNYVGSSLNIDSFIQLANHTEFKSRIIYPKTLEGKAFIKLEPIVPKGWFEKIGTRLGFKDKFKVVALSQVYDQIKSQ